MTIDITDTQEIQREAALARPSLGAAEFELSLERAMAADADAATAGQLLVRVLDEFDAQRAVFSHGSTLLTEAAWKKVFSDSEAAARRLLLEGSAEMKESERLNRQAEQSRKAAENAEASLRESWDRFLDLPVTYNDLQDVFARLEHEKSQLDLWIKSLRPCAIWRFESRFWNRNETANQTYAKSQGSLSLSLLPEARVWFALLGGARFLVVSSAVPEGRKYRIL